MSGKIFLMILIVCSVGLARQEKKVRADSTHAPVARMIRGIWWSAEMPQCAAFQIKDSTIIYPDTFLEFKYEATGDSLFVFREEGTVASFIVRVTKDTLVLKTFGVKEIFTREEPKMK